MTDTRAPTWLGLERRICVVTGAGSGIGAAIAQDLAQAGARVALLDMNAASCSAGAASITREGGTAIGIECDVSDESSVRQAARRVLDELGPCDVLVNNAGMMRPALLRDIELTQWNAVLAVNLTGYLLCAREFHRQLLDSRQGTIVNIASISALHPTTGGGAYSPGKAGVLQLSRQLAAEWGPLGIRSNAICPGMIKTPLVAGFYAQPGVEAKRAAVTASRRVGEPQDISNAVLFLASGRSDYVNGATLVVDGGLDTMLMDMVPRPGYNDKA